MRGNQIFTVTGQLKLHTVRQKKLQSFASDLFGITGGYVRAGWITLWLGCIKFFDHLVGYKMPKEIHTG